MSAPEKGRRVLYFGNHTQAAAIDLGKPALADVDFFIDGATADTAVFKGSDFENHVLAATEPARTVTVTVIEDTAEDAVTSITIVGRDDRGVEIREILDAATWDDSVEFETTKAFRSVESVELIGHVEATASDTFDVGFGNGLGLGVKIEDNRDVYLATLDTAIVDHDDSDKVVGDLDDVNKNLIYLNAGTYNGTKIARVIVTPA
jgi:hypothetical protein